MPDWLEKAVFYEIYPQSFYDSNGDGVGDLPGILQKLDYLQYLGINAMWLNPCFDSPFQDAGYDVRDYYQIAARYGTNDDASRLFEEAHRRGLRTSYVLTAAVDLAPRGSAHWLTVADTGLSQAEVASRRAAVGQLLPVLLGVLLATPCRGAGRQADRQAGRQAGRQAAGEAGNWPFLQV